MSHERAVLVHNSSKRESLNELADTTYPKVPPAHRTAKEIVKRATTARRLRKALCTYGDYMASRSTLPTSTDIATELTKHKEYDLFAMFL